MKNKVSESTMRFIRRCYEEAFSTPNAFHNWYYALEGAFTTPASYWVPISFNQFAWLYGDDYEEKDIENIGVFLKWKIEKSGLKYPIFMKTSTFSGKFNFENCIVRQTDTAMDIGRKALNIAYMGMCGDRMDCGFVLREFIDPDCGLETIYSGMPLHTEFRVFYDFVNRKVIEVFPYWDTATMLGPQMESHYAQYPHDKASFLHAKERLEEAFANNKKAIAAYVEKRLEHWWSLPGGHRAFSIGDVPAIWSLDFLMDTKEKIWLIDAAVGHQSYYWERLDKNTLIDSVTAQPIVFSDEYVEEAKQNAKELCQYIKVCPVCGNPHFSAHRVYHFDVVVDGNGNWEEDGDVYEAETPFGPFQCTACGYEVDSLEEID